MFISITDAKCLPEAMEKRDKIVEWLHLQSTDHCIVYAKILDKHEAGTGAWFLDHPDFKSWAEGDVKYLECYGMGMSSIHIYAGTNNMTYLAGAGKSVLA